MLKFKTTALAAFAIAASSLVNADAQRYAWSPDDKVAYTMKIIENYYLDEVDSEELAEEAIIAMLKTLDPHSSYSDPEETKELTTPLEGNFSGIGIQFQMINDTLYVMQNVAGGPCEKVGMLPGDRILRADTVTISGAGKANSDIIKTLRGPKGTQVDLEVVRRGVANPLVFRVIRDDIPMNSIDAAFMADDKTGYIQISRFAETTNDEFAEAVAKLRKQGMQRLIIDLESNGGGYLGSAVQLAEHFLRRGDLITYTESPALGRTDFDAEVNGDLRDIPVVVMVDQYSASASEILSGALQDHDRAVIVGRRTFGKGLVQRPFPFPDGSMIRLTVSRYHTPSGRVIQKPYEKGKSEDYQLDMLHRYESGEFTSADSITFDESLRYSTLRNRRPVYGGGGIMPDIFVPVDTAYYSDYYRDLTAKGAIRAAAAKYVDDHRADLKKKYKTANHFIDEFEVTPDIEQMLFDEGKHSDVEFNEEGYATSGEFIRAVLKGLIGRDVFDQTVYYLVVYPRFNPVYAKALETINDPASMSSILSPTP